MFDLEPGVVNRGCKLLTQLVPTPDPALASAPVDFVARFASRLHLGHTVQMCCRSVMEVVEAMGVVLDNTPPTVAAACVQFTCAALWRLDLDRKQLAAISGISNPTINKCCGRFLAFKDSIREALLAVGVALPAREKT